MMSWSHRMVVFVPGCLLCPSLQAGGGGKNETWSEKFRAVWEKYPIDLIQMPCPEVCFPIGLSGLGRESHGIQFYEMLEGFQEYCVCLAQQTAEQLLAFQRAGQRVVAVIGVEHSPTCAVSYMYTNQGTVRRAGLYLDALIRAMNNAGVETTYIGVNRRFPNKAVKALESAVLSANEKDHSVGKDV